MRTKDIILPVIAAIAASSLFVSSVYAAPAAKPAPKAPVVTSDPASVQKAVSTLQAQIQAVSADVATGLQKQQAATQKSIAAVQTATQKQFANLQKQIKDLQTQTQKDIQVIQKEIQTLSKRK